jgi:hypothetical protein
LVKEVSLSGAEANEASISAEDVSFSEDSAIAIVTTVDTSPVFQHNREKEDEPELIVATAAMTKLEAAPKPPTKDTHGIAIETGGGSRSNHHGISR